MAKSKSKKGKASSMKWFRNMSKPLLVAIMFGVVGVGYLLYQTFATSMDVNYYGVLTKDNPTAKYELTTGTGEMLVSFSNNTADQALTITNSANQVVGRLISIGTKDVTAKINVTAGTYTFLVGPASGQATSGRKGYSAKITYPVADTVKPTVVIKSPLNIESVSGTVDFAVDARDDTKVEKVELYVNNSLHATLTTAPYSAKWETAALTDGVYNLSAKAYDSNGNVGTASGQVTVKNVKVMREPFGMSAPDQYWDQRLKEVGGPAHIKFRRLFYQGFGSNFSLVKEAIDNGMMPIISFKVSPYTWAQVAAGKADADIKAMVAKLNAIPGKKFVALHHEPAKDGTAKDWSDMQVHALPIIKAAGQNIQVGVIGNGWWWSNLSNGYSDAEIAQWVTPKVISVSDVIAADTYQDDQLKETGGPKIKNMGAWARRVGGVKAIGIGEFNGLNRTGIVEAMNAVKAEPLVAWACLWNSDTGNQTVGTILTGDRLDAFKQGLATSDPIK